MGDLDAFRYGTKLLAIVRIHRIHGMNFYECPKPKGTRLRSRPGGRAGNRE